MDPNGSRVDPKPSRRPSRCRDLVVSADGSGLKFAGLDVAQTRHIRGVFGKSDEIYN